MSTVAEMGFRRQDSFVERAVTSLWFWAVLLFVLFSYPIYRSINRELPGPRPVVGEFRSNFKGTTAFKKDFELTDLKGKVSLIHFFETNCGEVCQEQFVRLQKAQKRVRGLGTSMAIVSLSTSQTDRVDDLYHLSRSLSANPFVWKFVRPEKNIIDPIEFKSAEAAEKFSKHRYSRWLLLDSELKIRGVYQTDKTSRDQLMIDIGLLANRSLRK